MYGENVGKTLQKMATVFCCIVVGASIVAGIGLLVNGLWGGLLMMLIGPVIGWFGTVMLYAFGTLVSNMQQASEKLERLEMLQRMVHQIGKDLAFLCDVKESEIRKAGREKTEAAKLG